MVGWLYGRKDGGVDEWMIGECTVWEGRINTWVYGTKGEWMATVDRQIGEVGASVNGQIAEE